VPHGQQSNTRQKHHQELKSEPRKIKVLQRFVHLVLRLGWVDSNVVNGCTKIIHFEPSQSGTHTRRRNFCTHTRVGLPCLLMVTNVIIHFFGKLRQAKFKKWILIYNFFGPQNQKFRSPAPPGGDLGDDTFRPTG